MKNLLLCLASAALATATAGAQGSPPAPSPLESIQWIHGPAAGQLGGHATVKVPEGYVFAGAADTRRILEYMENPTDGSELGFLAPKGEGWFVVFEFSDIGYVRDDDKDELDAGAILSSIRQGTERANKLRKQRGWGTLTIDGWATKPSYNPTTNNIEWATRCRDDAGNISINHNIRLLGRQGVMSAVLVAGPLEHAGAAPKARELLAGGYAFNPGRTYAEFRKGDKIAEYGLVGLITGGAAVVAVKSGLFKHLWKLILVGCAAVGGFLKKIFGGRAE